MMRRQSLHKNRSSMLLGMLSLFGRMNGPVVELSNIYKNTVKRKKNRLKQLLVLIIFILFISIIQSIFKTPKKLEDTLIPSSSKISEQSIQKNQPSGDLGLDFFIIGFPKCGTTSLLHTFKNHPETAILPQEFCAINSEEDNAISKLSADINHQLPPSPDIKRGIKCPGSVWDSRGITQLSQKTNFTKLLIGVRHPVLFFQSFYNYRVTEMHDLGEVVIPPKPESLIGEKNNWRDVSTDLARFELGLMQLGKVALTSNQLIRLGTKGRRLAPSPFKVFLYSLEQLNNLHEKRGGKFREDMQHFLGLHNKIEPFGHENINNFVGQDRYLETIDICEDRFKKLRRILVSQGQITQTWIRQKFARSDDVIIGGEEDFLQEIQKWGIDPCSE